MLKNYFQIAFRNLVRNKEYSFINIIGLSISIAACLILFYVIRFELSFDTFHFHHDQIFRIVTVTEYPEGKDYTEGIPPPLPEAMRVDFPQLKKVATIFSVPNSQIDIPAEKSTEEKKFKEEGVFFAEPQFFEIFDFEWLHGSPNVSLQEPNTVVLSEEIAEKYFGDWRNAIGKSIEYRNENMLKVTGILKNMPANTDFPLHVVISFKTRDGQDSPSWSSVQNRRQCYVLLDDQTRAAAIQNLMPGFEKKYRTDVTELHDHYFLQSLNDVHFDQRYGNYRGQFYSKPTLMAMGLVGIFLMITASINFINLAIAQVIKRSREVGVRKVLGSTRLQLAGQFFGETFIILIAASGIALGLSQLVLPFLKPILSLPKSFSPANPFETGLFLVAMSIVITGISAFYPARIMAAFKPVQALKSKISNQTIGGMPVRKGLLVIQFVIAQVLVIITLIVVQQLNFFRNSPLGFNKDAVLLTSIPSDSVSLSKIEPFRNTLLQEAEIKNVSFSFTAPISGGNRTASFRFDNSQQDAPFETNIKYADVEFFKTYDLSLAAGRIYHDTDTATEYVVNKKFLEKLGVAEPRDAIGKTITMGGVSLPIVGVLNNFHLRTLQHEIEPMVLVSNKFQYRNMNIKIQPRQAEQAIHKIAQLYGTFFPEVIFEYRFLDELIVRQYAAEERVSRITNIFSAIAIFVSCLGLYGLISFMAVQRTKEVGVRKVLGATVADIVLLFYKEFVVLLVIAFIISAPLASYFMIDWLNGFAYRINLSVWVFLIAFVLSLIICVVTVSFQSFKAAFVNPVDSLRSE